MSFAQDLADILRRRPDLKTFVQSVPASSISNLPVQVFAALSQVIVQAVERKIALRPRVDCARSSLHSLRTLCAKDSARQTEVKSSAAMPCGRAAGGRAWCTNRRISFLAGWTLSLHLRSLSFV